jgi:hypothetical protein
VQFREDGLAPGIAVFVTVDEQHQGSVSRFVGGSSSATPGAASIGPVSLFGCPRHPGERNDVAHSWWDSVRESHRTSMATPLL